MKSKGYIKLSRKSFAHKFWTKARVLSEFEAWIDLIQSARFDEAVKIEYIDGREIKYGRGQYPASIRFLAKKWSWGEQKVRTFLNGLKKDGSITTDHSQGMNVVTLCKYDKYNSVEKDVNTTVNTPDSTDIEFILKQVYGLKTQMEARQITHPQHSGDTNIKKEEKREEIPPDPPYRGRGERKEEDRFFPPAVDEVESYCRTRDNQISGSEFVDFYASKGWMIGKNKMKDWQAAVRTWEQNRKKETKNESETTNTGFRMHPSLRS